jgi:hypothetical protein
MVLNKLNNILDCRVDIVGMNRPGIYFLFDDTRKLIYIGESKFPLIRILDHFHKHYKKLIKIPGIKAKGIGPVFNYFRTMHVQSSDSRIRQHYEKRWIRKFNPPLNYSTKNVTYDLSYTELVSFAKVYDSFFKQDMSWFRYINDEVLRQRDSYKKQKAMLRRKRYLETGRR